MAEEQPVKRLGPDGKFGWYVGSRLAGTRSVKPVMHRRCVRGHRSCGSRPEFLTTTTCIVPRSWSPETGASEELCGAAMHEMLPALLRLAHAVSDMDHARDCREGGSGCNCAKAALAEVGL